MGGLCPGCVPAPGEKWGKESTKKSQTKVQQLFSIPCAQGIGSVLNLVEKGYMSG